MDTREGGLDENMIYTGIDLDTLHRGRGVSVDGWERSEHKRLCINGFFKI